MNYEMILKIQSSLHGEFNTFVDMHFTVLRASDETVPYDSVIYQELV